MLVVANQQLTPLPPEDQARRMDLGPVIRMAIGAVKSLIEKDRIASRSAAPSEPRPQGSGAIRHAPAQSVRK